MSLLNARQFGVVAIVIALATSAAQAQSDKVQTNDQLQGVQRQLEQSGQREKQINRELTALEKEAKEISDRLIALANRTQNSEGKISDSENKIARLDDEQKQLVARLSSRRNALGELLVGLQRLDRDPPPPLIVHPRDALAAIRSATLFGAIIPAIKTETTAIRRDLVVLKNVRAAILATQKDLKNETSSLENVRAELKALLERKNSFVSKTRQELEAEKTRTAGLVAKAKNLTQLLERIRQEKITREKLAKKQAEEREKQIKTTAARKVEEARKAEAARRVRLLRPKIAFTKAKGQLSFPARGQILRQYNQKNLLGQPSEGVLLGTRKQAQVTAPASGVVEFAGEFRSYGQLLILNVGEGYRMLLGGLGKIAVTTGQKITAGEPIGFMGTVAARGTLITAALDVRQPVLYIEFRKNGRTLDPSAWWLPEFKRSNVKRVEN